MCKIKLFIELLNEIVECAEKEIKLIQAGYFSKWDWEPIENIVYPEINELLSFALEGKVYFKYGKKQRMLESTYLVTDSLLALEKTQLGSKILELQRFYNLL